MRTLTLARMGRALMIAAAMIMLPQLASAQLPVETRALKLQGSSSGSVTLDAPATIGTPYVITLPDAAPDGAGALIYATGTGADLAWTSTSGIGDGFYPRWDVNGGGAGIGAIVWTDPSGEDNPNWSLTGNNLTTNATYTLGFPAGDADISIKTNNTERIGILSDGTINVVGTTNINASGAAATNINSTAAGTTTIGFTGGTITTAGSLGHTGAATITGATTIVGETDINATGTDATSIGTGGGAVNIGAAASTITTIGSLDHTGTSSFTGNLTLAGAASALVMDTDPGDAGDVLVSDGANKTPIWKNLTDAIGIREVGLEAVTTAAVKTAAISVTDLAATDAIIVTLEQSGDGTNVVVPTVTNRTPAASAGAAGSFTVTFSASYTGTVQYMVIKAQ